MQLCEYIQGILFNKDGLVVSKCLMYQRHNNCAWCVCVCITLVEVMSAVEGTVIYNG